MTTSTERQRNRRNRLNQIAQDAGFKTWGKYETSIIQEGKIEMNTEGLTRAIYNIVSGADNKREMNETMSAIEDWLNEGDQEHVEEATVTQLAKEFEEYYY